MIIDRKAFFDSIRSSLFSKGMRQTQVDGINMMLESWEQRHQKEITITQFADIFATAYHETATTMQPIHEYGNRDYFTKMYDKSGSRPKVAATLGNTQEGDGARFAGRGYVQLTGRSNYRRATKELRAKGLVGNDIDFEANPDLVMQPKYAIPVTFVGMMEGWFTGKSLGSEIDAKIDGDEFDDFVKARAIINGSDRAEMIAGHAMKFLAALKAAQRSGDPVAVPVPAPAPHIKPKPPVAPDGPEIEAPTSDNPAPKGWFAHLLEVLRSGRAA